MIDYQESIIDKVICYFKRKEVRCKKCNDGEHEFIAIFSYGNLSRAQIVKEIEENDLLCMFFEQSIREDEYKKKHPEMKKED